MFCDSTEKDAPANSCFLSVRLQKIADIDFSFRCRRRPVRSLTGQWHRAVASVRARSIVLLQTGAASAAHAGATRRWRMPVALAADPVKTPLQSVSDRPTAFSYSFPATRQLGYGATARCEFEHSRTSDRMGLWIEQCDKCVTSTARSSVVNDTCVVDLGHYLTAVWPVTSALHSIATRSSAIAEEPRDALWQLKPC